jgi:hypothetical protein
MQQMIASSSAQKYPYLQKGHCYDGPMLLAGMLRSILRSYSVLHASVRIKEIMSLIAFLKEPESLLVDLNRPP